MAEFAANNNELTSTKLFSFFASRNLHPQIRFDIVEISDTTTFEQINRQKALDISKTM